MAALGSGLYGVLVQPAGRSAACTTIAAKSAEPSVPLAETAGLPALDDGTDADVSDAEVPDGAAVVGVPEVPELPQPTRKPAAHPTTASGSRHDLRT